MRYYKKETVLDAALDRIRYLFDEFPVIIVSMSGGKDSTVCLELCISIAKEKNRLPIHVMWIDQEAEWQGTVNYMTEVMGRPEVIPMWYQMPMVITNNASSYNRYAYCWDEKNKDKWIHPKNDISIKVNTYGKDRFHDLFAAIMQKDFSNKKACYIAGMRAEENPKRAMVLTRGVTYKGITWGKVLSKKNDHYTFYPIYDWSYTDVWKYIESTGSKYNKVYDQMFRFGIPVNGMRISNLHHETALKSLTEVQEIEPETWVRLQNRIDGANTIKQIKSKSFTCPTTLPKAFESWKEYAYYLAENIIQEDEYRKKWEKQIQYEYKFSFIEKGDSIESDFWKVAINTILSSDWDFTKIKNFRLTQHVNAFRQFHRGTYKQEMVKYSKYLTKDQVETIKRSINENHRKHK
jgi:predicted phosphoadenosine phosphosulfate sulfurtransferase